MHIITLKERFVAYKVLDLAPGDYVVEDHNGAQLMSYAGQGKMKPLDNDRQFDDKKDYAGKTIVIVRAGGFGDITLGITPLARELKRRWPTCRVAVCTMKAYSVVLKGLPFVDEVCSYPAPLAEFLKFDAWIFLEGAVEHNPDARKLHMADLFAKVAGLKDKPGLAANGGHPALDDQTAAYVCTEGEMNWLVEMYPRTTKRRVSMQVGASAACRVYPGDHWQDVIKEMLERGWEVFLLGKRGEIRGDQPVEHLYNLTDTETSFRHSCAVINSSDVFIGNDSALLHVAGALGIPAVGLYGPFLGSLRTAYAKNTFAIQATGSCAPCFHHANPGRGGSNGFPEHCPSKNKGICEVLASIEPKRIVAKAEQIAKKAPLALVTPE